MSSEIRQAAHPYRSIFLYDDWVHQRYFGWRVVADLPGLRVLAKRRLVATRYLVLMTAVGRAALDEWLNTQFCLIDLTDIIIHDFDSILMQSVVSGRRFHRATQRERLLNTATFVIDLKQSEETLLSAMTSDYRRKIKKAEANGCTMEAYTKPPDDKIKSFLSAYAAFASTRGLISPDPAAIVAMYADGRALLIIARKGGMDTNYLHLYKAGDAAYFMYGVNLSKINDGAGQYLHWQVMRHLKSAGLDWYDLGGIESTEPCNGIYKFKEKFGGYLVDLGHEWRITSPAFERGLAIAKRLKWLARRATR